MESQLGRIYANAYKGPLTSRGTIQYSREWVGIGLGSADDLIRQQLEINKNLGKEQVTILDIGCTRQASFFTDLLNDNQSNLQTRSFLQQNPSCSLNLVGLTDATTTEEFGQVIHHAQVDAPDMRGSMQVFAYSLTAWQTLVKFQNEYQIESPSLVLAFWIFASLLLHEV